MKIIEILQYSLKKGKGKEFHEIMKETSVPLHINKGIDVVAYGNSMHDQDCYYLIRAFENEEKMIDDLQKFYSCDDWKKGPREAIINKIDQNMKSVLPIAEEALNVLRE